MPPDAWPHTRKTGVPSPLGGASASRRTVFDSDSRLPTSAQLRGEAAALARSCAVDAALDSEARADEASGQGKSSSTVVVGVVRVSECTSRPSVIRPPRA